MYFVENKMSAPSGGHDEFSPSTASMAKSFMFRGFDPEEYARAMAAQSDGDKDLIEKRENIRILNDETSMKLKKQVYLNYRQFIEAAREISALESYVVKISFFLLKNSKFFF